MAKRGRQPKYPPVSARIPTHLRARLQAASTVLGIPFAELVERALESHLESLELDETKRELIDRFASETLVRTDNE